MTTFFSLSPFFLSTRQVKGLRTSQITRRTQVACIKKYAFCPLIEERVLDADESLMQLRQEILEYEEALSLLRVTRDVQGLRTGCQLISKPMCQARHAFMCNAYNHMPDAECGSNDRCSSKHQQRLLCTRSDILFGNFLNLWPEIEKILLEPLIDLIVCSIIKSITGSAIRVIEVSFTDYILYPSFQRIFDNILYFDQFSLTYTISHPEPDFISLSSTFLQSGCSVTAFTGNRIVTPSIPDQYHVMILNLIECPIDVDVGQTLVNASTHDMRETSHVLIIFKDRDVTCRDNMSDSGRCFTREEILTLGQEAGFVSISQRCLFKGIHPLLVILMQKKNAGSAAAAEDAVILQVGLMQEQDWLPKLMQSLKVTDSAKQRIWLTLPANSSTDRRISGIYGLVKSLHLEDQCDHVRCFIDLTSDQELDVRNDKFRRMLQQDLLFNVFSPDRGYGFYTHTDIPSRAIHDPALQITDVSGVGRGIRTNFYLRSSKVGDLSSIYWSEAGDMRREGRNSMHSCDPVVDVHYAALNFKDVMYATGRLAADAASFFPILGPADLPLGLEFSGMDANHNRVMGIVPCRGLASQVRFLSLFLPFFLLFFLSLLSASSLPDVT